MPTYRVQNIETGKEFDIVKGIKEMDLYMEEHPELKRLPVSTEIGDSIRLGIKKHGGDFKEVMETIHERAPGSTLKDSFRW